MALTAAQQRFAYYVISTVETHCDYGGVNQVDAITLGIVQWYGQNAYYLMDRLRTDAPDAYDLLSARLKSLTEGGAQTWNYWTGIYLQNDDASSWVASAELESNRAVQDAKFMEDAFGEGGRYDQLRSWGLGDDPKTAIFYMVMQWQRPASASACMGQMGGNASISALRDWCLSNSILGNYRNRYNDTYNMLNDWDGESEPPDFGMVDPDLSADPSGESWADTLRSEIAYCMVRGTDLVLVGDMASTETLLMRNTGKGIWIPVAGTVPNNPGAGSAATGDMPPASQDDPADFPAMRELWEKYANQFNYSQGGGRLDPLASGYSDCSACIYWAANYVTDNKYSWIGTWTGAMVQNCHQVHYSDTDFHIDVSILRPGDLIVVDYDGNSSTDHVDWYMGGTTVWSAGSAPLPHKASDDVENYYVGRVKQLWILRFLD